eukprot:TRINITY_DN23235_c0_g1_i1.p1 TRINITY_DN23235_c0_g1~~TRINITY_DN23235_c0_g1_i1.p1  ORF type:complete len:401 (+),score=89.20 TRINITY_DN23235_c0_g1_i1:34-1203(+)
MAAAGAREGDRPASSAGSHETDAHKSLAQSILYRMLEDISCLEQKGLEDDGVGRLGHFKLNALGEPSRCDSALSARTIWATPSPDCLEGGAVPASVLGGSSTFRISTADTRAPADRFAYRKRGLAATGAVAAGTAPVPSASSSGPATTAPTAEASAPQQQQQRPGRLAGPVVAGAAAGAGAASVAGSPVAPPSPRGLEKSALDELPAFRHLAALAEAVDRGDVLRGELPDLPWRTRAPKEFDAGASAAGGSVARRQEVERDGRRPFSARDAPLRRHSPRGPDASAAAGSSLGSTFPGSQGGSVLRGTAAAPAASNGFARSALRGTALPKRRYGGACTAQWLAMEGARLMEAAPKPLGSSPAVAYLLNGGPEGTTPLDAPLTNVQQQWPQ